VTTKITNKESHTTRSKMIDFAMISQACEKTKILKINLFRKQLGKVL